MDNIGVIAGFVLTLMVFSYVLGDNLLYRLAVYVLVGISAGFIGIITVESVLMPWFQRTIGTGNPVNIGVGLLPVLLATFLLLKTSSRLGQLGNLAIAFIVGIGSAVAVVGAVTGTLLPLTTSTGAEVRGDALNTIIIFFGVICTLIYFQYVGAHRIPDGRIRRNRSIQLISVIGQGFIVVTLAAIYAAAILTSLTIFTE
ncbi:MAG TPA: hypothetical protein VHL11_00855, partial [Phototrophicaceae bacterium]|nr:hypothetical protein [Phototrophicaceae bacterium]